MCYALCDRLNVFSCHFERLINEVIKLKAAQSFSFGLLGADELESIMLELYDRESLKQKTVPQADLVHDSDSKLADTIKDKVDTAAVTESV